MSRKNYTAVFVGLLLVVVYLGCFLEPVSAQHRKVPKDPFQVVDASTGKPIPEILVLPLYSSFSGVFTVPAGPHNGTVVNYSENPFIYHTGEPFILKRPTMFTGAPLLFLWIGKARDIDGVLMVAPGYSPLWIEDLWGPNLSVDRKLMLTPISDKDWLLQLEKGFSPFVNGGSSISGDCETWNLSETCGVEIHYNKKERELVRSFLQQTKKKTD